MLSKSFTALIVLLVLTSSTKAQATIAPPKFPALDLKEAPISDEAQRPSIADPCSNVKTAQSLDTSTSITADETGAFLLSPVNFNLGADGSRSIDTVQVDASGTGKNFVVAHMAPNDDTQQFIIQLPAGTKCTGGTNQNLCLASITTTSGLENCVVVSQAADTVSTTGSPLNAGQVTDVRSRVGKQRKHVKRSASADEDGSEPAPAQGNQTSGRIGDKLKKDKKKKKNKEMTRHNQNLKITGKRFWSSRLSQLTKLTT